MAQHEVIVVGLGAWGAAAAHDLARSERISPAVAMKFVPFIGRAATSLVRGEPRPDLAPFDPRRFAEASIVTRTRF